MDLNNMGNYVSKLIGAGAIQPDDELSNYLRSAAGLPEALEELEVIGPREQAEMQQQQFQMNLEAKAQAKQPKEGNDAKPSKKNPKAEVEEEETPAGVKGKEVEKFTMSSNTWGNKYHGDDGRFASASIRPAMVSGPDIVDSEFTDNIPDLGPVSGVLHISPSSKAASGEIFTEFTYETYSQLDESTKQNGISNLLVSLKDGVRSAAGPQQSSFPKLALEIIVRSKDKKALATFNTPDFMNSNDLRAQVINNAHYGDKWGKIKY
jgi:hypothetical protein